MQYCPLIKIQQRGWILSSANKNITIKALSWVVSCSLKMGNICRHIKTENHIRATTQIQTRGVKH